ncbi:lymphocyte antigen 6 complex locus protein G6f isoform X1 [Ornithorhynchus anatinus]|uniref:lymphocyte antigen 6 complex locus protein G6f isoform X1 n=1 Tax=Ornithorhynchus anatinus TaxID=9258 RepID=UPI0019D44B9C|nr:lymphocyte antigen 6 complex locus protein G6f isoform X1 [Ornithorhynchus anatinus]
MATLLLSAQIFLLLLTPGWASEIQKIYIIQGDSAELACPPPDLLEGDEQLSWFHNLLSNRTTRTVVQVPVAGGSPVMGEGMGTRLRLQRNHSLRLDGVREGDAGRYWCSVRGPAWDYQNWKMYEVTVLRGTQLTAHTGAGAPCSILICSVASALPPDPILWHEGSGRVKGRTQVFNQANATLLLLCPREVPGEGRSKKPRNIRCVLNKDKGINFILPDNEGRRIHPTAYPSSLPSSLPATSGVSSFTHCDSTRGWDITRILLLLCVLSQVLAILVLGFMVWKRRDRAAQQGGTSTSEFKPEIQVYENIHSSMACPSAAKAM